MTLQQEIIRIAKSYIGRTEKKNNAGFNDPIFEQKMRLTGWQTGEPWCAYFAELVLREAAAGLGNEPLRKTIAHYFSGSSMQTIKNFQDVPGFLIAQKPQPGDVVIFQYGRTWQGHTGIVVGLTKDGIETVEGNSNTDGSREGTMVVPKKRRMGQGFTAKGLNIVGFIRIAAETPEQVVV